MGVVHFKLMEMIVQMVVTLVGVPTLVIDEYSKVRVETPFYNKTKSYIVHTQ